MASERLSRLQCRILAWLLAEEQRTRGTMAADHRDLVRALGHDQGNLSTSLKGLAAKGLVTIARTPGGKAEAVDLRAEGWKRVAGLARSCEEGGRITHRRLARPGLDLGGPGSPAHHRSARRDHP